MCSRSAHRTASTMSMRWRRYAEREAIVRGYASMAGFAREQVNVRR